MKRLVFTLLLLALAPHTGRADPRSWMIKQQPAELGIYTELDGDCPGIDLDALVGTLFTGAQLVPKSAARSRSLYLNVIVSCLAAEEGPGWVSFHTDIRFGRATDDLTYLLFEYPKYGKLGRGRSAFLQDSIRGSVETAIAEYLEANEETLLH